MFRFFVPEWLAGSRWEALKRLVREWLASRDEDTLFSSSTGQSPSLSDIVRMVHPKPTGSRREAFYGYMLGRPYESNALPKLVMQFGHFKAGETVDVPDLPFMLLSALPLSQDAWLSGAECLVADHANESEYVRPPRSFRSGRHGNALSRHDCAIRTRSKGRAYSRINF
jgi:hypothetical protein